MQISVPIRAPTWVSTRRLFEQNLTGLHKCTDIYHLKQFHALLYKANLHGDPFVAPKLIAGFSLCRQMALAVKVFSQIQYPNVHLYNTLIRAHIQNSQHPQAFATFFDMQHCGVFPDNFTYPFLLKACSGKSSLRLVQMIHTHIEKFGFCSDIFVPNSLIDSYSKCGVLGVHAARKLFTVMVERDIVSWNSMVGGLVKAGELSEARRLFDEMPDRDTVSWNTILDGYSKAGEMDAAFELFQKIPDRNVVSWSTMISGYCKAGDMEMARILFDKMPTKNLVTWTIIISGYAQKGLAKDAISLFDKMEDARFKPDDATIISILAACAESGLLGLGKRVHGSIERIRYKCGLQWDANALSGLLDILPELLLNIIRMSFRAQPAGQNAACQNISNFCFQRSRLSITMEACIHPNSFSKNLPFLPSFKVKLLTHSKRNYHQSKCQKVVFPSSITCCHMGALPSEDDSKPVLDADWRSFRARLVAGQRAQRSELEELPSGGVDSDAAVNQPPTITIGDKWAHTIHEPEKGCLLIATEKLDGVHIFERTVILLLSTGPVGPTGIILNRPSLMSIKETKSTVFDVAGTFSDMPLFFGGPLEEGLFLVSPRVDGSGGNGGGGGDDVGRSGVFEEVMKGLYYGSKESVGCAAEMVKRNVVEIGDFRFFDGYCGWEEQQLKDEIRAGFWTVAACSPNAIGLASLGSVGLWEEVLGLVGPRKVW
ncbi:hypothetical protein U1Q18_038572 [Sarracenia purpurea var. burkii]